MKNVAREATNGVIYGESGEIVKNGLRVVCPRCGEIGLYPGHGGSVNIWTVGAIERRECTKCRIGPLELVCSSFHGHSPFLRRQWTAAAIISFTMATTIRKIPSFASMVDSSEEKVYSMGGR